MRMVQRLVNLAKSDAASLGRAVTAAAAERLAETLDAALVDPGAPQRPRGRCLSSA